MEKKQFLYLMTRLANGFKEDMTEERFEIYFEFLGKYEYEPMKKAVDSIIINNKWFPKIAEIQEEFEIYRDPISTHTRHYLEEMDRLEIEHKQKEPLSKEEARGWFNKIANMLKSKPLTPMLDGDEAIEFERKRQIAKEKSKELS